MPPLPTVHFFDGRTPRRRPAKAELGGSRLRIRSTDDGSILAEWPYDGLQVVEKPRFNHAGLLACERHEDQRLAIDDPALFERLAAYARRHAGPSRRGKRIRSIAIGTAAVAVVALSGWFLWTPALDMAARAVPRSWERAVGRAVLADFPMAKEVCRGAEGQAALERLVKRLAGAIGADEIFEARVARGNQVNAFALPGGQIVILSGLLDKAASADELAGVLAHEMAHIAERHPTRLLMRHFGISLLLSAMLGNTRVADAISMFGLIAYTREFEAQADARGLEILKTAGMRTGGLASFFGRMEKDRGDPGVLRYLSTHPPTAERRELAQRLGNAGEAPMSDQDWKALRAICAAN